MKKKDVYEAGYAAGHDAATYVEIEPGESLRGAAFEAEENARQFSPFEHLASEINQSPDPDGWWEAYERGVVNGITDGVKARTARKNPKMSDDARELELFIENDGNLYRQMTQPIQKNLVNKMASGKYSSAKALKAWENLATEGAKRYCKEFCSQGAVWHHIFPVAVRREVAESMRDAFEGDAAAGEFQHLLYKKYRKNPEGWEQIDSIGDQDPIEWGGGIVFETEYGPIVEYTHGLDWEGSDPKAMEVYRVPIPDNVFEDHTWANLADLADFQGTTQKALKKLGKSRFVTGRVAALEAIASYYGWHELDHYPSTFSAQELKERWDLE